MPVPVNSDNEMEIDVTCCKSLKPNEVAGKAKEQARGKAEIITISKDAKTETMKHLIYMWNTLL